MTDLKKFISKIKNIKDTVKIALVGKYVELKDAYLSVYQALKSAGYAHDANVEIEWIKSMDIKENNVDALLSNCDGILVPGGFGQRGSEGKILAIKYAREHNVPFLGICLGMQLAVIEYAEDVLGMEGANSTEFDPESKYPVIDILRDQYNGIDMGGTLRLGSYDCKLTKGSLAESCYKKDLIRERHRHRYEFNSKFAEQFASSHMKFSGINPQTGLVEIVELDNHPFFIASQFHPEFTSRPLRPNPLFDHFVGASILNKNK